MVKSRTAFTATTGPALPTTKDEDEDEAEEGGEDTLK